MTTTTTKTDSLLILAYLQNIDSTQSTKETYRKALTNYSQWLSSHGLTIAESRRIDVLSYKEHLKASYSVKSVNLYMNTVKRFYEFLSAEFQMMNSAQGIRKERESSEPHKNALTTEMAQELLSTCDKSTAQGLRDYAMLLLMISGGLRCIEVSRLNNDDVELLSSCCKLRIQGKGSADKNSAVVIPFEVYQAIEAWRNVQPLSNADSPLFQSLSHNSRGNILSTRSISGMIKERLKLIGINSDKYTAHSLRHTAISLAIDGGCTVQEVQQMARHSNINTTMIYIHMKEIENNQCSTVVSNMLLK